MSIDALAGRPARSFAHLSTRLALLLAAALPATAAYAAPAQTGVTAVRALAVSPDGKLVATVRTLPAAAGVEAVSTLAIGDVPAQGMSKLQSVTLPCTGAACKPADPVWSRDGKTLAFVLRKPGTAHQFLYATGPDGHAPTELLDFDGTLEEPRFAPDGTLAVLATAGAHKLPGATSAGAALTGEIGESEDEQRIATIAGGKLSFRSPANLYVYQYDWIADPKSGPQGFVATAAPGNGDDNWWKAKLLRVGFDGAATTLFAPPQAVQLADPTVSTDGRYVSFVGGIMSDFGSTGGDLYTLDLTAPGKPPLNQTAQAHLTITGLHPRCGANPQLLTATALAGSNTEVLAFEPGADPTVGRAAPTRQLTAGPDGLRGLACGGGTIVAARQDFTTAPEITVLDADHHWRAITDANAGITAPYTAKSLGWHNESFNVQGWLLAPKDLKAGVKHPLIVEIHGGPGAASTPRYITPDSGQAALLNAGYMVLLPNPRGSFGQGEAFTLANRRDFGHGDLRDIMAGVDAAIRTEGADPERLGVTGYSYGGYMTMWTITQTNRFKAAVAGAGVSDWQSYYGENGIDGWMLPFFGASVYDDPAIYAHSSPIAFVKNVKTPTFIYVGDADVECPMPQSQELWHALHDLGVPTSFVVYPGQGHGMASAKDRADAAKRTVAWFDRWLKPEGVAK